MKTISSIYSLRKFLAPYRAKGRSIGFVPTMGALHDGHLALIRRCRKENDLVVVSIFVNPTQFGPKEDFRAYPRNKKQDCALAESASCDIVFAPSVAAMYPTEKGTTIDVPELSQGLCGAKRPGHFQGVATVVTKLFNIVQPDQAYFGQKDYQQVAVIKQMVVDLNLPVCVHTVPTFREPDGLAMSSRNRYLTCGQRKEAPVIYRALQLAKTRISEGEQSTAKIKALIRRAITSTSGKIDYIECVNAQTLKPITRVQGKCVIAAAVIFGKARLIDNIVLQI